MKLQCSSESHPRQLNLILTPNRCPHVLMYIVCLYMYMNNVYIHILHVHIHEQCICTCKVVYTCTLIISNGIGECPTSLHFLSNLLVSHHSFTTEPLPSSLCTIANRRPCNTHIHIHYTCSLHSRSCNAHTHIVHFLMRNKEASKFQTNNKAKLLSRKMSCLGWDNNREPPL